MPELIEPEDPGEAAEEIVALQDLPAETEDVQAHTQPVGGCSMSATSAMMCDV